MLLFINVFIQNEFFYVGVLKNLVIVKSTRVDCWSYCSEVCENWLCNKKSIVGFLTLIVKRKYNHGRVLTQVWLFGRIERECKKLFIIPLLDKKKRFSNINSSHPKLYKAWIYYCEWCLKGIYQSKGIWLHSQSYKSQWEFCRSSKLIDTYLKYCSASLIMSVSNDICARSRRIYEN